MRKFVLLTVLLSLLSAPALANGETCAVDSDCIGGTCYDGTCHDGANRPSGCNAGDDATE